MPPLGWRRTRPPIPSATASRPSRPIRVSLLIVAPLDLRDGRSGFSIPDLTRVQCRHQEGQQGNHTDPGKSGEQPRQESVIAAVAERHTRTDKGAGFAIRRDGVVTRGGDVCHAYSGRAHPGCPASVPPRFWVNVGLADPLDGVIATWRFCGIGSPPPSMVPAISVWKLTFTSPAGKCRVPVPGTGTSPYASYLSKTNRIQQPSIRRIRRWTRQATPRMRWPAFDADGLVTSLTLDHCHDGFPLT